MDFVIDRSKWRSGSDSESATGVGHTELINSRGFMCCLGQCELQIGTPAEFLLCVSMPHNVPLPERESIFINDSKLNSTLAMEAAIINDNVTLSLQQREEKLSSLFISCGHTIKFTGEPVKYE